MKVKSKKLTKAQKLELIKEQANTLTKKTALQLKMKYDDEIIEFSIDGLYDASKITQSLLDFPSNAVILNEFLAELNLISYDLEEIPTAPLWIGKELQKLKNAGQIALWAAEFRAEADPILSNPQSTIQQVLDVHNKYQAKFDAMYPSDSKSYDRIYAGSRLVAYQDRYRGHGVKIQIMNDYEWVEKESE